MIKKNSTKLDKFSMVGLLLLIFLLPLQTRWIAEQGMIGGNSNEFLTVSLYGVDILITLLVLFNLYLKFEIRISKSETTSNIKNSKYKTLANLLLLFVFWNMLSIFWAGNKILAEQHMLWMSLAMGLAWLVEACENKINLMYTILVGLTLSAWLGIWQFVSQITFANKWLGLALHDPKLGGSSIVEIYAANGSPIRWLRAYGPFDHPNIFGVAMVVGIIILIIEILRKYDRNTIEINRNKIEIKLKNIVLYLALASMSAGLFVSLSRSAWLGLIFGIFIIVILKFFKSTSILLFQRRMLVFPVVLIAATFAIMAAIYPAQFLMRSGGTGRLEEKSFDDRAVYLQQGKEIIKNNLLFGVGAGNYIEIQQKNDPSNKAWTYQPVHNFFLLVLAELGIIGMLILLTLMFSVMQKAWQSCNVLGIALLASIIPTLLFDHWLWSLHFGVLFLGLIMGIILKYDRNKIEIL